MRFNRSKFLIPIVLFCFTGCGTFSGNIAFQNDSDKEIFVKNITGFEANPPCGILIPEAYAGAHMHTMKFPSSVTIYWSYESLKGEKKTVINLSDLKPPQGYSEIIFIFNPEYKWTVKIKDD